MAKFNYDSQKVVQPYRKLETTKNNEQILDILLSLKQENSQSNRNEENNKKFILRIKEIIDDNLSNKTIRIFSKFQQRGTYFDHDILSLFVAFDPKNVESSDELINEIISLINDEEKNHKFTEKIAIKQDSNLFQKIPYEELESNYGEEESIIQMLYKTEKEDKGSRVQNRINTNSSFDAESSDETEDSQQLKNLEMENIQLKKENEILKKMLQENQMQTSMWQHKTEALQQQQMDNIQIIIDQKQVLANFQKECQYLSQEKQALYTQNKAQKQDVSNMTHEISELLNQTKLQQIQIKEMEISYNKSLEEKSNQLNKFVTYFLIGENTGKCYSNDRVKQRTWEVQEYLKANTLKKQLREILQLQN